MGSELQMELIIFLFHIMCFKRIIHNVDCLCGLVVRVSGYRSGGPGFNSWALQEKKVVGLKRGPFSLVSTLEELTE
jgi:hypothetical protein